MTTMASQIISLTVVYSTLYLDADQRKHQSSASLAFVWGIHRDRWIPRTKGQLRGKCFHLMTSSCLLDLHYSSDSQCQVRVGHFSAVSCFYRSIALHCNWISVCSLLLTFHFSKGTQHKCTDRCFQIDQPQSDQWKHSNYLWYHSGRPELKAHRQYQSLYGWFDEWLKSRYKESFHICWK